MTTRLTTSRPCHPRGAAAVLAMLFLVLLSGLATAMFHVATLNGRGAAVVADAVRARALAESGLRWQAARLADPVMRPRSAKGRLSADDADDVWFGWSDARGTHIGIRDRIAADWRAIVSGGTPLSVAVTPEAVEMNGMRLDGGLLRVRVERLGADVYDTAAGSRSYRHFIEVSATATTDVGTSRELSRTSRMRFSLDKRIDFAVVGRTRIQLGRNTLVDGPVAMGTAAKFSPYLILSDLDHFDSWLAGRLEAWHELLVAEKADWGNRIRAGTPLASVANEAGFTDRNGDGWLDEFDLLLARFDTDGDGTVSRLEFTGPGGLYEPDLWAALDFGGGPMFDGDTPRAGWGDDRLDTADMYAKVRGTVSMRDTAGAWQTWLDGRGRGETIRDLMRGPIVPDSPDAPPVVFGAPVESMIDLSPANFEEATQHFRDRAGEAAGTPLRQRRPVTDASGRELWVKRTGSDVGTTFWADPGSYDRHGSVDGDWGAELKPVVIENATLTRQDADRVVASGGTGVATATAVEQTPYGSTSFQATYERPVFRDVTFRNVQIPKGLNPLFENCTFEGVTFVDVSRDVIRNGTVRTSSSDGMWWSRRMKSGSFSNTLPLTDAISHGFSDGNNIRFDNCTFRGPLTGGFVTAYTHFTNSWEFTGNTKFENVFDGTATILSPQTNIEMGSFERPGEAPSTLVGVIVAGNIDIRGSSIVDGSIIVTGDGAGDTTLGYFGPNDNSTDTTAMPETGGFGRLNIRYNPYRALPDGINIHVLVEPVPASYRED